MNKYLETWSNENDAAAQADLLSIFSEVCPAAFEQYTHTRAYQDNVNRLANAATEPERLAAIHALQLGVIHAPEFRAWLDNYIHESAHKHQARQEPTQAKDPYTFD